MSVVARGVKNAFRNWLRTGAVVLILAIGIGLALSMLVARQAVEARINDLKADVGTTLMVNPAGSQGFQGGGEPLKMADADTIKSVDHVQSVDPVLSFMLQNTDGETGNLNIATPNGSFEPGKTDLESSIEPGTLGQRFNARGVDPDKVADISLPVRGIGTLGNTNAQGKQLNITEGRGLNANDTLSALVGKDLAAKNGLKIGSTFMAYDQTFTVVGIFDQGTQFENDTVVIPLAKAQELSGQTSEVSAITVRVDSIENLDATSVAIKSKLGSDKADVTSTEQNVQAAIKSLQSVQQVTLIGFIAALAAAAVIIFLIMLVIVRERKREIGVLKAIGGSNRTIVTQFMVEAVVLVAMGAVVGLGIALVSSNGIANALVEGGSETTSEGAPQVGGPGKMTLRLGGSGPVETTSELVGKVTTSVGAVTLLWGALATIIIAVVGSAVPAWFIAKVRPAEVMRGE